MASWVRICSCAAFVLLASCDKEEDAEKQAAASFNAAKESYDQGKFEVARTDIDAAIRAQPQSGAAHFLAGQIAEQNGDLQIALEEYVRADSLAGGGAGDARLAAAALLLRARAYKLAEEWISRGLADRPGDRAMKAYRALLKERLGDSRKARADAEEIIKDSKGDAIANAVLAEQALRRKDQIDALAKIESGLSTDPSNKLLLQLKAKALMQQGSREKAIELYRALIASDPASVEYRTELAELFALSGDIDHGEQILTEGVQGNPASVGIRLQLVDFLAKHRGKNASTSALASGIQSAPQKTVYDVALAATEAHDGNFESAKGILLTAIARVNSDPSRSAAQLALARLLVSHDDTAEAKSIIDDILKRRPDNDDALAIRGQLLLKDGELQLSIQELLSVASRRPADASIFVLLADAYLANDQYRESMAALNRASNLQPADISIAKRKADVQAGFGNFAQARQTIDEFVERNPDSIEALILQGRLAIRAKDPTSVAATLVHLQGLPSSDASRIQLDAEATEAAGDHVEAASLYRQLLVKNEDGKLDIAAARAFARASVASGQSGAALDTLALMSGNVVPGDLLPYDLILALLNDELSRSEESRKLVEEVIVKAPTSPAAYLQQAAAFARKKQIGEALAFINRGIAAGAPKEPLLLARAQIQTSDDQIDGALTSYREIILPNPKSVVGANELANLLADRRPADKSALAEVRDILLRNATFKNQAILDTLAWVEYRLGNFDKAKAWLIKANAERSADPQIRFHYGAVLIALGESVKGKNLIRQTLNDAFPGKGEAQQLLDK